MRCHFASFLPADPLLSFWSLLGRIAMPWLSCHARNRLKAGKEDPARLGERFGKPGRARPSPQHHLIWIHAASVGESLCVLPLVEHLLMQDPALVILMTTATLTGGQTVAAHSLSFTGRLIHQLCPYDAPHLLTRFLDHWQPCGLVLVESELWPGMLGLCRKRHLPVMLINGRLSTRSARFWRRAAPLLRHLLRSCHLVMPRSEDDARIFKRFGITALTSPADLKEDARPLPYDRAEAAKLKKHLGSRPVFVAVSTHPGEEETVMASIRQARQTRPALLGVIIPRHPERGTMLATHLQVPRRSVGQLPGRDDHAWLIDTLGEVGLFLHLAERVFIGNSLCKPGGGHNPLEPLRFHRPTAMGPYMQNWQNLTRRHASSLQLVEDEDALARWLVDPHPLSPRPVRKTDASRIAAHHVMNLMLHEKGCQ